MTYELMLLIEEENTWPEMEERQRAWFNPAAAARAVMEPELKALLPRGLNRMSDVIRHVGFWHEG